MISEKDIEDFKDIDCTRAKQALYDVEYTAPGQMHYCEGLDSLKGFIESIELIQKSQVKQVAALFKPKE